MPSKIRVTSAELLELRLALINDLPPALENTKHGKTLSRLRTLSKAEIFVLRAIALTGSHKSAAAELGSAQKTVENHLVRVHKKLHEGSTVRCVLLAERAGLLKGIG